MTTRENKKNEGVASQKRRQAVAAGREGDTGVAVVLHAISDSLDRLTESKSLSEEDIKAIIEVELPNLILRARRTLNEQPPTKHVKKLLYELEEMEGRFHYYILEYNGYTIEINIPRWDAESDKTEGGTTGEARQNWKPEGPDDLREPKKDLRDEDLKAKIIAKLDELPDQKLSQLWTFLADPQPIPEPKSLPTEPPGGQLYENRPDKSENAPEFIRRVYGDFLDGTFTRADLKRINPKAESALRNWEQFHKKKADLNLPTVKERNDALVAAGLIVSADPLETVRRAKAAAYRAKK